MDSDGRWLRHLGMGQYVRGSFAALLDTLHHSTQFNEGEIPGVTANASWKLSAGTRSDGRFPDFPAACARGGGYNVLGVAKVT